MNTGESGMGGLRAVFDRQHEASRRLPAPGREERRAALARLARLVRDNAGPFAHAISEDFGGRSPDETDLLEITPCLRGISHARARLGGWMKPERRPVDLVFQPSRAFVRYEPLGVVGIVSPWNYPLLLALSPLTDALAAGNRAMLKPSERTPALSDLLARLVGERFDPAQVAVITGGVTVAEAFSALPFDHLVFTGSTAVGRAVMRAAAENLTPVTLELGGKSPAIVAPDYPLEKAARSIAFGKLVNAGQTCIAPDYALVPAEKAEAFCRAFIARAQGAYPAIAGNADYSAICGADHRARLHALLEEAEAAGATVFSHAAPDGQDGRIAPAAVLGAPEDTRLMTEEIFGPILPVVPYGTLEEAAAHVAARPRPLALYLFSDDRGARETVLSRTVSGGVTVNGTLLHVAQEGLPFGGVGASGMGAYHGRDGFRRLSHARAVYEAGPLNLFERLGPPWGRLVRAVTGLLKRMG